MIKKFCYGLGNLPLMMTNQVIIFLLANYYYNLKKVDNVDYVVTLIPIASFGFISLIARIVDAIVDPPVGNYSDNFNSKWGRRIPFIAIGVLPLAISFYFLWSPPINALEGVFSTVTKNPLYSTLYINMIYLTLFYSLFFVFYTVVGAPYNALLPEIATNKKTRIEYSSWMSAFGIIGLLLASAASIIQEKYGYQLMGAFFACLTVLCYLPLLIVIREKKFIDKGPVRSKRQKSVNLFKSIKLTLENKIFRIHLVNFFLFWFSTSLLTANSPYLIENVLGFKDKIKTEVLFLSLTKGSAGALALGGLFLATLFLFPIMAKLSKPEKFGKKRVMLFGLLFYSFTAPFFSFLHLVFSFSPLIARISVFLIFFILAVPISIFILLFNAVLADITDEDEKKTGMRREGMYFGAQGFFVKLAIGFSALILISLLFPVSYKLFGSLKYGISGVGIIAGISTFIGFLFFRKYPIDD